MRTCSLQYGLLLQNLHIFLHSYCWVFWMLGSSESRLSCLLDKRSESIFSLKLLCFDFSVDHCPYLDNSRLIGVGSLGFLDWRLKCDILRRLDYWFEGLRSRGLVSGQTFAYVDFSQSKRVSILRSLSVWTSRPHPTVLSQFLLLLILYALYCYFRSHLVLSQIDLPHAAHIW